MTLLFSFLHHLGVFTLVGALLGYGFSGGAILIVGLLRVIYFEQGTAYYFQSVPLINTGYNVLTKQS